MRLRDAHFFARVPADVSEVTSTGGMVSIAAMLTMLWLVLTQYQEFATVKHTTQLRLDQASRTREPGGGASIRINFNVTMHHLPCQYAAVHVADHVGSHKMGGVRNVHKVRVDAAGASIGMYEPHKYVDAKMGGADEGMAGHVFPWHKKQHQQGDAGHRREVAKKGLSNEQKNVMSKVESTLRSAGKGAQAGRRLLAIEEPQPAAPAEQQQQQQQQQQQPSSPPPATPTPDASPDTSPSCATWADSGECLTNAVYMLGNCEASCAKVVSKANCAKWGLGAPGAGACKDAAGFMAKFCPDTCSMAPGTVHPAVSAGAADGAAQAAQAAAGAAMAGGEVAAASDDAEEDGGPFTPPAPFSSAPSSLTPEQFTETLHGSSVVMVNFYAPWCYWSKQLEPTWDAVARRLHGRAYSQQVKFLKVDCTQQQELCKGQSIHAFPSVRIYRGSAHAFEPYEFGREENVIWLHLVKTSAEILVNAMQEADADERKAYAQMIAHVSKDLRVVMERRAQGLDEDWSEEALSQEEEVREDRDLLDTISRAVSSITGAKGVVPDSRVAATHGAVEAEAQSLQEKSSDVVMGLLARSAALGGYDNGDEAWQESATHEGCMIFGYIDVSRAPGTLHIAPHSARHSFDFSAVNTSHFIDHLSFGLELNSRERSRLPPGVTAQLASLDGASFTSLLAHETKEHHVNIMPTSYARGRGGGGGERIETYQFTATSHGRTRDTLPSLVVSYDVSPIHAEIIEEAEPLSSFLVSLCAIVGGAFSVFGIVDGLIFSGTKAMKRSAR